MSLVRQIKESIGVRLFSKVPFPSNVWLELTNACNLNCPLCVTGNGSSKRKTSFLSFNLFKKIVNQLKKPKTSLILSGYGEPFLNKNIYKMLFYLKTKNNIFVHINTNAHFITNYSDAKKLVNTGVNYLNISFDGLDQKTYEKYRKNGDFEKVLLSVKNLVKAKKELNSNTPHINLQFLMMKHNQHQISEFESYANSLDVDSCYLKSICLNDLYEVGLEKLAKDYLPIDKTFSRYENLEDADFNGGVRNSCSSIGDVLVIDSTGNVLPCLIDFHSMMSMGNLNSESISTVWNGALFNEFRKKVEIDQANISICATCPWARTQKRVSKYSKL